MTKLTYPTHSQGIASRILKMTRQWVTATEVKRDAGVSHKTANAYLQLWAREGLLDTRLREEQGARKGYTPSEYKLRPPELWEDRFLAITED
jgi:response regulator of citrate/malate metabolism